MTNGSDRRLSGYLSKSWHWRAALLLVVLRERVLEGCRECRKRKDSDSAPGGRRVRRRSLELTADGNAASRAAESDPARINFVLERVTAP